MKIKLSEIAAILLISKKLLFTSLSAIEFTVVGPFICLYATICSSLMMGECNSVHLPETEMQ
jgi:hypothetical protein